MGLDMYLTKKVYVQNWDHHPADRKWNIKVSRGGKPVQTKFQISYLTYGVAYWRKANAIHQWFVDNCQDGVDECQEAYVSEEKLKDLLDTCKKVQKTAKVAKGKVHRGTQYSGDPKAQRALEKVRKMTTANGCTGPEAEVAKEKARVLESKAWKSEKIMEDGQVVLNEEEVSELLPTQGGFFFGGTDYDDGYMADIKETIGQIEAALADPLKGDFYYQASW